MESKQQVQERRQAIVQEMLAMESMKRGTFSSQYLKVSRKGHQEKVLRGPYHVVTRKEKGRTVSVRVPEEAAERVRQDVARYARFMELAREFVELTERMGDLEEAAETIKKKPKLQSKRITKQVVFWRRLPGRGAWIWRPSKGRFVRRRFRQEPASLNNCSNRWALEDGPNGCAARAANPCTVMAGAPRVFRRCWAGCSSPGASMMPLLWEEPPSGR